MNVLSLFDGMSCGQIAINRIGLKCDRYLASEIDVYSMSVTKENYPDTEHIGSVVDIDTSLLPEIDLLIGGSPCQSFSFAGTRKGMATSCSVDILSLEQYLQLKQEGFEFEGQSYLFWEYMRILKAVNPTYFLLENVRMSEKWQRVLSRAIGIDPIMIDSCLVSGQSRKRLFWTNIGTQCNNLFGIAEPGIGQPEDRGILLRDILQGEEEIADKFYLKEAALKYMSRERNGRVRYEYHKNEVDGKAGCLTANMWKGVPYGVVRLDECKRSKAIQRSVSRDKSTPIDASYYKGFGMRLGICRQVVAEEGRVRRLTPMECERLQTVPDNYTSGVSDSQRYKMLGNGWTVDVIAYILGHMDKKRLKPRKNGK